MTKRILWIEDASYQLGDMMRPLKKAGYEVTIARDSKGAISLLEHRRFDLIILDILIPSGEQNAQLHEEQNALSGINFLKILKIMKYDIPPIVIFSVVEASEIVEDLTQFNVKKLILKGIYEPEQLKKDIDTLLKKE
jgi:two-component system, chemotaxis family, chemotaxis protein CheY